MVFYKNPAGFRNQWSAGFQSFFLDKTWKKKSHCANISDIIGQIGPLRNMDYLEKMEITLFDQNITDWFDWFVIDFDNCSWTAKGFHSKMDAIPNFLCYVLRCVNIF